MEIWLINLITGSLAAAIFAIIWFLRSRKLARLKEKPVYEYRVGGRIYYQKPLALARIKKLILAMGSIDIPISEKKNQDAAWLLAVLGDRISSLMAIVLDEGGFCFWKRSDTSLAAKIEASFDLDMTMSVIEDFFVCNPIDSISERLTRVMKNVMDPIRTPGSTISASSSVGETSQNGTMSSGDTH